jgi:hypothetical protein
VPVWKGAENLAPTGIRSPDLPVRSKSVYQLRYPGPPLTSERKIKDIRTWRHYPANATIINKERILPGNSLHARLEAQGWANYYFWISFQVVVIIRCFISVYFRSSFYLVTTNCFAFTTTKYMQHRPSWVRHSHAAFRQIFRPLRSSIDTILPLDYTRGHTNQITHSHPTYLTFILIFSSTCRTEIPIVMALCVKKPYFYGAPLANLPHT